MFTTFIVQPIFNVLTLLYALLPGHNFGLSIIIFTVLIRYVLYPLLKKQLRHTKAMRDLQPEIKKIKQQTKGNKQQTSLLTMELYKEREIKPLANLGLMVVQIALFLALFSGLNRVVKNPQEVYDFSYPVVQNTSQMQKINENIDNFDNTLIGGITLDRAALETGQSLYIPALLLVLASALIQFFQIRQTMPSGKDSKKLREILKDAGSGKQADNTDVNAAMGRNMSYFMPIVIFVLTIGFPAALSLYWFVSGAMAFAQQSYLLKQDEYAMTTPTATVISKKPLRDKKSRDKKSGGVKVTTYSEKSSKQTTKQRTPSKKSKKRRRR